MRPLICPHCQTTVVKFRAKKKRLHWKITCNKCRLKWEITYKVAPFEDIDVYGDFIDMLAKNGEIPEYGIDRRKKK